MSSKYLIQVIKGCAVLYPQEADLYNHPSFTEVEDKLTYPVKVGQYTYYCQVLQDDEDTFYVGDILTKRMDPLKLKYASLNTESPLDLVALKNSLIKDGFLVLDSGVLVVSLLI